MGQLRLVKFWEGLSVLQRRVTMVSMLLAGTIAIATVAAAGYQHFSTDAEREFVVAQLRQEQRDFEQTIAVTGNRAEINRSKREINRINAELLDPKLSPRKIALLKQQKEDYEKLISCIRSGNQLCY